MPKTRKHRKNKKRKRYRRYTIRGSGKKTNQNNTNYEDIISKITTLQKEMNETI